MNVDIDAIIDDPSPPARLLSAYEEIRSTVVGERAAIVSLLSRLLHETEGDLTSIRQLRATSAQYVDAIRRRLIESRVLPTTSRLHDVVLGVADLVERVRVTRDAILEAERFIIESADAVDY